MKKENGKWKKENGEWALLWAWSSSARLRFSVFHFPFSIFFQRAWWWLRQVSGDAAYENYLRGACSNPSRGDARLRVFSREEFYLDALRRKYTGVTRCC